ncbi:hypothetical protein RCL_jg21680.t1 [Rhizophagus clarus]|uniref:Uncharacterized protein n=1 Tax=Rhizophagus clarus TaxID=94130 RepID=A0A8H3L3W5_9GLOM|nr:hypothetical protein RCL_jg21680.t1 [Rhizophagus clarus]
MLRARDDRYFYITGSHKYLDLFLYGISSTPNPENHYLNLYTTFKKEINLRVSTIMASRSIKNTTKNFKLFEILVLGNIRGRIFKYWNMGYPDCYY